MQFQLFSDIHLEFLSSPPKITPVTETLILAGDIGKLGLPNFKEFFDYCSKNWKNVVFVPGNHEYYNASKTYANLNARYREFFNNYGNVHFLDNDIIELDGFLFVGATLWSHPSSESIDNLSDFKQIKETNLSGRHAGISLATFIKLHNTSKKYIDNILTTASDDAKVVVVTHFPPSSWNTSNPKYPTNPYFATDILPDLKCLDKIKVWCFGHTHHSCDIITPEGVRLVANQIGYVSEVLSGETGFSENGVFLI